MCRKTITLTLLFFLAIAIGTPSYSEGYSPRVGESLDYEVVVKSIIHGANQSIKVVSKDIYANRPVVKVQFSMETVGLVWNLTKYSEKEELILDSEGLYPWYLKHEVRDKDKYQLEEVTFDYAKGIAVRCVTKNGKPSVRTEIKLPGYVQDGLSLQFYFRKYHTKGDGKIYFYSDGDIEEIDYQVEEVKEPLTCGERTFPGYFEINNINSKITVLVAAVPEKYPLVIRKIAKIGKVEARIATIQN